MLKVLIVLVYVIMKIQQFLYSTIPDYFQPCIEQEDLKIKFEDLTELNQQYKDYLKLGK